MPLLKHRAISHHPDFSPGPASTHSSCENLLKWVIKICICRHEAHCLIISKSTDPLVTVFDGNSNMYRIEKRFLVAKSSVLAAKCTSDQVKERNAEKVIQS